jgi:hypothetical protein
MQAVRMVDDYAFEIWPCSRFPRAVHIAVGSNRRHILFSILPALAFSLDMFTNTGSHYGVNEVLLASVLGAVVFSLFSCQPLVIVGVTGK